MRTTRPGRWRHTPRQREAQAHERDEVQWTKHAPKSVSQAQQPDLTSRGGVLEECLYEQRPHDMSTTTYTTQPQGLALCSRCHPAWALEAPQWVRAKTPTVHWGPNNGEAVGGPAPTPQMGRSRCSDASSIQSNTHVFRQTAWVCACVVLPKFLTSSLSGFFRSESQVLHIKQTQNEQRSTGQSPSIGVVCVGCMCWLCGVVWCCVVLCGVVVLWWCCGVVVLCVFVLCVLCVCCVENVTLSFFS